MIEGDIILTGTQVSKKLGLKPSTFRKYQDVLEKAGYTIKRNDKGHRQYTSYDVMIFEKLINYKKHDDITLEKAAALIMEHASTLIPYDSMTDEQQAPGTLMEDLILTNNEKQQQVMKQMIDEMEQRLSKQIEENHKEQLRGQEQRDKQTALFIDEWREQQKLHQLQLFETASTTEKKWYDFMLFRRNK